jgi:hypothetical protein
LGLGKGWEFWGQLVKLVLEGVGYADKALFLACLYPSPHDLPRLSFALANTLGYTGVRAGPERCDSH